METTHPHHGPCGACLLFSLFVPELGARSRFKYLTGNGVELGSGVFMGHTKDSTHLACS